MVCPLLRLTVVFEEVLDPGLVLFAKLSVSALLAEAF
jgi:hypothetical protein